MIARLAKGLAAAVDRLVVVGGHLASYALMIMAVGVTLDVLARFVLGAGTKMAVEFSGYLLVAIVFLGLAYTHKADAHIRIDVLIRMLPRRLYAWFKVFDSLLFLSYTAFLGYFGWGSFLQSYQFNTTSRTGMDVPLWPYQLFIPLGLGLISLLLICNIFKDMAKTFRSMKSTLQDPRS